MIRELIVERIEGRSDRPALGSLGPSPRRLPGGLLSIGTPRA